MYYILIIFAVYLQSQASFSKNVNGLYEDTEKKLLAFSEQIDKKVDDARLTIKLSNYSLADQEFVKLRDSKLQIQDEVDKRTDAFHSLIEKAKKLNINPENCTKDLKEIEIFLPRETYDNITKDFASKTDGLTNAWIGLFQNLTNIPKIVKDLKNEFYKCSKTDNNCIETVSKAIDKNEVLLKQAQEIVVKVLNIFREILEILDACIDRNIQILIPQEETLIHKGTECIKDLLK